MGVKIKIIQLYGNGTIRLPQDILNKLNLKKGDKLVITAKHDGFVVCKIEDYSQNWMDRFDVEFRELDNELRRMFTKDLNRNVKKDKNSAILSEENKTEIL